MRAKVAAFLDQSWVGNGIIAVIVINAVLLGLGNIRSGDGVRRVFDPFVGYGVPGHLHCEILLKLFAHGLRFLPKRLEHL